MEVAPLHPKNEGATAAAASSSASLSLNDEEREGVEDVAAIIGDDAAQLVAHELQLSARAKFWVRVIFSFFFFLHTTEYFTNLIL